MHKHLTEELALIKQYQAHLESRRHRARANQIADKLLKLLEPLLRHATLQYAQNIKSSGLFTESDLYQLGQIGALEAFKSFDPNRGSFTSHVNHRIHRSICHQLYKHQAVRLSYHDWRGDSKSPRPDKPSMVSEPAITQDPYEPSDWLGDLHFQQNQTDGSDHYDPETLALNNERDEAVAIAMSTLNPATRQLLSDIYGFTDAKKRLTPKEQLIHDQAIEELRHLITGEFTDMFESLFDSDLDLDN